MSCNRRSFLSRLLASPLAGAYAAAAQSAVPSKITRIETVYWKSRDDAPFWPHWTWVKIDTDTGLSGIGETYPRNPVEAAVVHSVAGSLIGRDPRDIERIWADLYRAFDFQIAGGAEIRALSAIDLALWDLLGKHLNAPVYRLIGGKSNPRVRLYNTCFPYKYDFNREPEKIMRELIDTRGIKAIKVWPFDGAARRNRNQFISPQDIAAALKPVQKLRDTFGDGDRDRRRIPRAVERHLRHPHRPCARALPADVAGRHAHARQLSPVPRAGRRHEPAAHRGRANGRQNAIRGAAGISYREIRHV